MTFSLHGIAISGGYAIGRAQLYSHDRLEAPHYLLRAEDIDDEVARILAAQHQRVTTLLSERLGTLERAAAALIAKETLSGEELRSLVSDDAAAGSAGAGNTDNAARGAGGPSAPA